jgi:hypothetical protein
MANQKRRPLDSLIDQDMLAMYRQSQALLFACWLDRRPRLKWILETWATKPWRR